MRLATIISRYADPDPEVRRRNVLDAIALAQWAAAQGYCPVGWWCDIDPDDPPCDDDPEVRAAAIWRSTARARLVGQAGGIAIIGAWYDATSGMQADIEAFYSTSSYRRGRAEVRITAEDIAPYLAREKTLRLLTRAGIQDAINEILYQIEIVELNEVGDCPNAFQWCRGMRTALSVLCEKTGMKPEIGGES